jgi:hypothetical protein
MCPNIQQMSVISAESPIFTFWGRLLDIVEVDASTYLEGNSRRIPRQSLRKLQKLTFQTNVSETYMEQHTVDFNRIYLALLAGSPITELRASGVTGGLPYQVPPGSTFKTLQRVEITQCTLPIEDIDNVLSTCDSLRHFFCHWAFLWCHLSYQQTNLLPNLQRQHKTLETLCLMANRTGFDSTSESWVSCPSLSQMTTLKEAKLCNLFIPDKQCRKPALPTSALKVPIAPELPPSLEHLTISYTMQYIDLETWRLSVFASLQQLADDCTHYLPQLRELVIQYEGVEVGPYVDGDLGLIRRYGEKGVRFSVVEELDVLATLG